MANIPALADHLRTIPPAGSIERERLLFRAHWRASQSLPPCEFSDDEIDALIKPLFDERQFWASMMSAAVDQKRAAFSENRQLKRRLLAIKDAADEILGPICAEVGAYLIEAPEENLIAAAHTYGVTIPASAFERLYELTNFDERDFQEEADGK